MSDNEQIIQYLRRIEDKQNVMSDKVSQMEAYQRSHKDMVDDHEERLRKSETILTKVAVVFSAVTLFFGSITAAVANKLFNG